MSEDQYFKVMADKLEKQLDEAPTKEWNTLIYLALKEVARDQRYACLDAYRVAEGSVGSIDVAIHNAKIKYQK